ncbi:MAG: DHH family phosphoesterase, partial [Holosporaceae bacterium]|nr:DHH family phosphoesterase [Holosporaceae bacterium]
SISNIEKHKKCLIIAVDCGSNSLEELKYAKTNDIDVIVIDHHRMSVISEDAIIINPHRPDEKEDYRYLCASGLVFICIVGVNRLLREMKFYSSELVEPDLMDYTDLTALATVCDVVSLVGLNRAFVSTGMKVIRQRKNFGIDALLSDHRGTCINSETISFFLGPKLNASGRMASSDLSVRLLTTKNPIEARKIAQQLDDLNKKRQNLELEIMEEAVSSLEERQGNFICLYNADWHVGIIGIIAGRLREKYNKPSIIISRDANGIGKASCRSIEDVDISDVIRKGVEQGIIISGGGHSMAAGFLIDISKIDDLMGFLSSNIKYNCIPQKLCADCLLPLDMISLDLLDSISILEPFGMGNQQPRFVIPDVNVVSSRIVGNNHVGFTILDEKGNSLRAISFRSVGTELGDILLKEEVCSASLLGTLILSSWGGQNYVNFRLEDISSHSFGVNKNE